MPANIFADGEQVAVEVEQGGGVESASGVE